MRRLLFTLFAFILLTGYAIGQLYIWTDKDGVKHFTNTALPPEAENVEAEPETVHVENDKSDGVDSTKPMDEALKKRMELKKDYEDKKNERIEKLKKYQMELKAARGELKKHWEALYGPVTGSFETGLRLQTKNFEGNLLSLTDGSNWSVVGYFPGLQTAIWMVGDKMSVNRKDGILINLSKNPDIWIKVRSR